jgi:hypothetical protein
MDINEYSSKQKIYPVIEEDIKWWENDDDNVEDDERKDYEKRVRARVRDLKHQRNEINGNIFQRNLDLILNHHLSKKDFYLKEIHEMWKESNNLDSYIDALERKIELEFQPLLKLYLNLNLKLKIQINQNLNQNP